MRFPGRAVVLLFLAAPLSAEVILTMKSGERYDVPQPPKHRSGMVSFTTKDGRFLTVKQSEVAREETVVPVEEKKKLDRTDTKQLGAIAREQRAERGIDADVAGKPSAEKASPPEKSPAPPKKSAHRAKKHASPPPPHPPPPDSSDSR
ncbi:MAG TPA: hypothetical protein VFS34_10350 [Thermoanaerobaculia bacterium]|nr:hypothetical protein [Thermoanaerobaculia bacterium]